MPVLIDCYFLSSGFLLLQENKSGLVVDLIGFSMGTLHFIFDMLFMFRRSCF